MNISNNGIIISLRLISTANQEQAVFVLSVCLSVWCHASFIHAPLPGPGETVCGEQTVPGGGAACSGGVIHGGGDRAPYHQPGAGQDQGSSGGGRSSQETAPGNTLKPQVGSTALF